MKVNHYKWLDKHLPGFFSKIGIDFNLHCGIVSAHGDKCYSYEHYWKEAGIEFPHGVAIYLASYCNPFDKEVRETKKGWVHPFQWVIDNKDKFVPILPSVDPNDKDVCDVRMGWEIDL